MAKVWMAQGRPSPIRISNTLLPMELDTAMSPIPGKDRDTVETKTEIESTNTFNSASVKWGITPPKNKKIKKRNSVLHEKTEQKVLWCSLLPQNFKTYNALWFWSWVARSAKQNHPIFYWKLAYFLLKLDNKKICLLGYQAYFCWQMNVISGCR